MEGFSPEEPNGALRAKTSGKPIRHSEILEK